MIDKNLEFAGDAHLSECDDTNPLVLSISLLDKVRSSENKGIIFVLGVSYIPSQIFSLELVVISENSKEIYSIVR